MTIRRLISGGRTGADRAGLEAAKEIGIATGGTAPRKWRICNPDGSDGSDPSLAEFGLIEHSSYEYRPRTIQNVLGSDGTVWFGYAESPGGKLTLSTARKNGKPTIVNPSPIELREWAANHQIEVLNVAGNRLSPQNPDIAAIVYSTITAAFGRDEISGL